MAPITVVDSVELINFVEANSFEYDPNPTPTPEPEVIVLNSPGDIQMFMMTNDFEDVSDRFEVLTGIYKNGFFSFHIRTLSDKMSAREGRLLLVPNPLQDLVTMGGYHITIRDVVEFYAPRASDWPHRAGYCEWLVGPDDRYSVAFQCYEGEEPGQLTDVYGFAASSNDKPWNWHYGLGVLGKILVVP